MYLHDEAIAKSGNFPTDAKLICGCDGRVHPVEINKTAQPGRDAVRHFSVLANLGLDTGDGAVICLVPERLPITAQVEAIPAWQIGAWG